jgi:hypothetical protein
MIHFNIDYYVLKFLSGEHGKASGVGREIREKMKKINHFINGEFVESRSGKTFPDINPAIEWRYLPIQPEKMRV